MDNDEVGPRKRIGLDKIHGISSDMTDATMVFTAMQYYAKEHYVLLHAK